jgi:hypothetical protein
MEEKWLICRQQGSDLAEEGRDRSDANIFTGGLERFNQQIGKDLRQLSRANCRFRQDFKGPGRFRQPL